MHRATGGKPEATLRILDRPSQDWAEVGELPGKIQIGFETMSGFVEPEHLSADVEAHPATELEHLNPACGNSLRPA